MLHLRPVPGHAGVIPPTIAGGHASPLVLCDRLITLAQEADRAGHPGTASQLIHLAHAVFDETPEPRLS